MATPEQELAAKYVSDGRLFDAKRELVKVSEDSLTPEEKELVQRTKECESSLSLVKNELDPSWKSAGETKKGNHVHTTSYKTDFQPVKLDFIVECAIEKGLVYPLLAVINEVDLYPTWVPKWNMPKFQIQRAEVLKTSGKTGYVCTIRLEGPLATAEFYADVFGVDDTQSSGEYIISIDPMEEGDQGLVPPMEEGVNRAALGGGVVFRKCPEDRAEEAKKMKKKKLKGDEEFVLFSLSVCYANKRKSFQPGFFIKKITGFLTKVVSGMIFAKLLSVAEEVREGKRPEIEKAMEEKKETYQYLKGCVDRLP